MKYTDIKRYKFSTILKNLKNLGYNFTKVFKFINIQKNSFKFFFRYLDFRSINLTKITKYINPNTYDLSRLSKVKFTSSKFLFFHLPAAIIFFGLLYLVIPSFYSYDKSKIEKILCKNQKIKCSINGDVSYRFYPTPRIKIKDLTVNDFFEKEKILIKTETAIIKLSFSNLLVKEKHKFKEIKLNNYEINFDLKSLKNYGNFSEKKIKIMPIVFTKGKIIFYDGKDYVATIDKTNINIKFFEDFFDATLKGNFLNDNIYIKATNESVNDQISTDIILKMSQMNFLIKTKFFNSEKDKSIKTGNFLIKKDKNKIAGVFDYKNNEFKINKSNLKNSFLEGELLGEITLLPYFNFNLDLNLNSLNFTRLYNYFLTLNKKEVFKINNKINGNLNLSADKINSKYNLTKSFESRLKFNNGDILVDQFLINLGKLGAVDIVGIVDSDEKFTNFKFESNVFVDNQKKFLSKFGIYNKENISSHFFVSGNFDLINPRGSFYEISHAKKLNNEDINYIEKEFNNLMLEDGYNSLFHFPNFKEFIKSVTSAIN